MDAQTSQTDSQFLTIWAARMTDTLAFPVVPQPNRMRHLSPLSSTPHYTLPLLIARVITGVFFSISGFNKLFVPANAQAMLHTMHTAGIPFPEFNATFVASVELTLGAALLLGLLTRLASLALLMICIVATFTDGVQRIPANLGPLDWLGWFLYLPEVLYALILAWILLYGPGAFALDRVWRAWSQKNIQRLPV